MEEVDRTFAASKQRRRKPPQPWQEDVGCDDSRPCDGLPQPPPRTYQGPISLHARFKRFMLALK